LGPNTHNVGRKKRFLAEVATIWTRINSTSILFYAISWGICPDYAPHSKWGKTANCATDHGSAEKLANGALSFGQNGRRGQADLVPGWVVDPI
jgi:hypothetical protein